MTGTTKQVEWATQILADATESLAAEMREVSNLTVIALVESGLGLITSAREVIDGRNSIYAVALAAGLGLTPDQRATKFTGALMTFAARPGCVDHAGGDWSDYPTDAASLVISARFLKLSPEQIADHLVRCGMSDDGARSAVALGVERSRPKSTPSDIRGY